MGDLKIGQDRKVMGDVVPGVAFQARIGLIQPRIGGVGDLLGIERHVDAVPLPERVCAKRWLDRGGDIRALHGVGGEHVAVVESTRRYGRKEHP